MNDRRPNALTTAAVALAAYAALAVLYTWPLSLQLGSAIASDPYDPVLNASVLWWNATNIPLTSAWWNPPYFHPTAGVTAFTENLLGLSPFASPAYWVTHNPIAAYNTTLLCAFALSGFAAYLLAWRVTGHRGAAFLAGLAYAFAPYRADVLPHVQTQASFWLPLALLGLHGFLEERRGRWLVLFGVSWVLQSLADGYYLFFGAVLIALWLAYFCSTRRTWRALVPIGAVWAGSSLALAPILLKYRQVHDAYGLHRSWAEAIFYSAKAADWIHVVRLVSTWHQVLPDKGQNLFPGLTAVTLVVAGVVMSIGRSHSAAANEPRGRRWWRWAAAAVAALAAIAITATIIVGPWETTFAGIYMKMTDLNRGLAILVLAGGSWLWLTRVGVERRNPLFFYAGATVLLAILCFGPVLQTVNGTIMDPAPYGWLMTLPGFVELRVPSRFWMFGMLCLSTAAAVSFSRLPFARSWVKAVALAVVCAGVLADGWVGEFPIAKIPAIWDAAEPSTRSEPILELPAGPEWDAAATFRSMHHRRPVFNGVSGYDPPHYAPLLAGIDLRDAAMLPALATLGAYDIVVNKEADPDGTLERYAGSAPGATRIEADASHAVFRIPPVSATREPDGRRLAIASVQASGGKAPALVDGHLDNEWVVGPQEPGEWVEADLGSVQNVARVVEHLGLYARDFPRGLAIDTSADGREWQEAWAGPTAARAMLAAIASPLDVPVATSFEPRPARYVRLRQLATSKNLWRIAELEIDAP